MKRLKCLPLLACAVWLCGCGKAMPPGETRLPVSEQQETTAATEAPTIPPDWTLPDNAVSCQIELMDAPVSYHFFDDRGNEILAGYPDLSKENVVRTHYTYNDDGTYAYRSVQDNFGTEKERYVYNDDLTVKQCYTYQDGKEDGYTLYSYDKHRQPVTETYIRLDDHVRMYQIRYKNTYNDAGQLVEQKRRGTAELNIDTTYEYDAQGNMIHETVWSPLLGDILIENRYTYDTEGRLLTAEQYSGEITVTSRYAYVDLTK